jgi:ketosteroid isomerase-like protein
MSRHDVEVVRASFAAWNRGSEALREVLHPNIEWRAIEGAPDDVGPMEGLDALQAYAQDWFDHFDNLRLEPEELIDVGDRVVAVQRLSGRARESGIETELRYAVVYTVRGDKIARGREYLTREQALEAVHQGK